MAVKKQPAGFRRRKLSAVVRKAITSYHIDQEQLEIEKAAKQQKISTSSSSGLGEEVGLERCGGAGKPG
jgi:hypothetical protein